MSDVGAVVLETVDIVASAGRANGSGPGHNRWRPRRAGIRNIWEYDDQEFVFADGRLVLRGPNGSGKSNALALLVPFLLDGVMSASRMDSLSGGRSMRTLLLCLADDDRPNRFRHDQRTGYVWLELARGEEHVTIGCGARASVQRDADAWFFLTQRRPGIDLELAPGGVPLGRGALVELLGAGCVFDSAESYRAAVDRTLFGLGEHRYANLLDLLLVLRRPHLAGRLNLELLSKVLSDGLAAIDDRLLADVAASFEDLESVQSDLRELVEAHRSVQAFLPVYRRYLRAAGRQRAHAVAAIQTALAEAGRRVAEAERGLVQVAADTEANRLATVDLEGRRAVAEQRRLAVYQSGAYRDAASLVEVDERAGDLESALQSALDRLETAQAEYDAASVDLTDAESTLESQRRQVDGAYDAATGAADRAGVAWPVPREHVEEADLEAIARGLADRRRRDVSDVRAAQREAEKAAALSVQAARSAEGAADEADQADDARRAAAHALDSARADLGVEFEAWAQGSGIEELRAVVPIAGSVGEPDAPSVADAVASALRPRRDEQAAVRALAVADAERLAAEREELEAQRRRVAEDPMPAPDRWSTRPADRTGRPGAPLYACCDFGQDVDDADRAGLEAALEAAGLLDAWLGGESDQPDERGAFDAWLRPGPPAQGPTLADVLIATPPTGAQMPVETVRAVLASVSLGDVGVAVLPDGRFHLGPLRGRFGKPRAELIGATAREERRQRLLEELGAALADLQRRLVESDGRKVGAEAELGRLDAVAVGVPSSTSVLRARDELTAAVTRAQHAREAADRARADARAARQRSEERAAHLRELAADRRLPFTDEGLSEAEQSVHRFGQRADALAKSVDQLAGRRREARRAADRVERAVGALGGCELERDRLSSEAAGLRARADQLRAQLGADAQAPLRELAGIDREITGLREESARLAAASVKLGERRGAAEREKHNAAELVAELRRDAEERMERLEVLRRPDVWEVVGRSPGDGQPADGPPPAEGPPDAPVDLAAIVEAATADVTAEPDDNALQRSYRQLLDDLSRGYDPGLSWIDRVAVVEVTAEAGTFSVVRLERELADRVTRQRELLTERDREIFERHLLSRVANALRDLLNDADELVEGVNRSLADRPTASGKTVALRWEPDSTDPAVRDALGLLRHTPDLLGPDERDRLRRFFQSAIAQERAENPAAGYAEVLRRVFDYRNWHAFVPMVRSAGGGLQRLTRTLFRSLSGGEQAVVLHLPLFAAAAAHYDASPGAPRLIALDEAFAGIDEGMRAELMGLLVRFDLDVVLTGHELWGAYAEVPALMVYDLLRQPPLEGVSAVAARWDGRVMGPA